MVSCKFRLSEVGLSEIRKPQVNYSGSMQPSLKRNAPKCRMAKFVISRWGHHVLGFMQEPATHPIHSIEFMHEAG